MDFLNTEKEIKEWLDLMKIKNYNIFDLDGQLVVDVDGGGGVSISGKELKEIPVKFNVVKFSFFCSHNQLETLKGCPEKVGGSFFCENNKLKSLEGCPKKVGSSFDCSHNQLTSLNDCPKIEQHFDCSNNKLVKINNKELIEYFKLNDDKIDKNQLLDTNFLDGKNNRYKELFKTMTYDLRTIKENQKLFKQFLDAGLITIEQVNLDLWR